MRGRWGKIPFVALTSCLVLGIASSRALNDYIFAGLVFAAGVLAAAALLALSRSRNDLALFLGLSVIALVGLLLALSQRDRFAEEDLRALRSRSAIPLGELTMFDGCIVEDTQRRGEEVITTVDLHGIRQGNTWLPCEGKVLLRMTEPSADDLQPAEISFRNGDRLRGWAEWSLPRNFQNPGSPDRIGTLARRGIFLVGRVKSPRVLEVIPGDCGSRWTGLALAVRDRLRKNPEVLRGEGKQHQAAVLTSLLVGDYTNLDSVTREIFQNSGTYHVLVVSGLHVAWIAGVLLHAFRLMRMPSGASRILVAGSILFYARVVGFEASISRCLWMFGLYLIGQSLFRRASPANIVLASGFLLLVLRPDWLFDAGFQLSFLSVIAICVTALPLIEQSIQPLLEPLKHAGDPDRLVLDAGRIYLHGRRLRFRCEILAEALADRWGPMAGHGLLGASRLAARAGTVIASMILISCSVQVWLEPVLAYHFNRLSWVAPLANLVVVPLSSVVLAAGVIAALTPGAVFPVHALTHFAGWLSSLLLNLASWTSGLPGAWQRCPTPSLPWVVAGLLLLSTWYLMEWRRSWIPWVYVASLLTCLSCGFNPNQWAASFFDPSDAAGNPDRKAFPVLRLTFLDVGEGDSMVMRFPDSRVWVLDAGGIRRAPDEDEVSNSFDIGEAVVSRFLWHFWITRLDRAVLSHSDQDHSGGMPALLRNFKVAQIDYGERSPDPALARILAAARDNGVAAHLTGKGDTVLQSGVGIRVLNPPGDALNRTTNDNSIVLHLEFGRFSALLTGDLEARGEVRLLSSSPNMRSLLLKVSHHGSRHGTMDPFIARVAPRWAVISVGRNNPFGHPSPEVLARLLHRRVRPLLTTDYGAISFETDGLRYVLESHVGGILETGMLPEKQKH